MNKLRYAALAALIGVLLTAGLVYAQSGLRPTEMDWLLTKRLTARNNTELWGTLTVDGASTFSRAVRYLPETLTVTGTAFTPLGAFQPITTTDQWVTPTLAVLNAGTIVHLYSTSIHSITFADGANTRLASDYDMGISDTLTLISDGDAWIELARSNN